MGPFPKSQGSGHSRPQTRPKRVPSQQASGLRGRSGLRRGRRVGARSQSDSAREAKAASPAQSPARSPSRTPATRRYSRPLARPAAPPPNETDRDDQEDVPEQLGAKRTGQELLPPGHPRLVQGGQDGHRVALPHGPLRGRLHAHRGGLPPQVLRHPRRALPARHPRHLRPPPVPRHAAPLHPHRRRFHSGVQPGQPRILRGGAEAQAADPGHQVLPQEQTQGAGGRAPGAVRQQGRPRPPPRGGAGRGPAAAGRRPSALRLLRGLGQKEQQPGPHVPGALRHGRAARGDEPGPAPPGVRAALRGAAPGAAGREAAARRRPGGRPGHRGALRAPAQRAQRPPVRAREGGRPGQGQGALRDQLGLPLPEADSRTEGRPCRLKVKSRSGPALSSKCPGVFPPQSPARQLRGENGGGLVICFGRKASWVTGASPRPTGTRHQPLRPDLVGTGPTEGERARFLRDPIVGKVCVAVNQPPLGSQKPSCPPRGKGRPGHSLVCDWAAVAAGKSFCPETKESDQPRDLFTCVCETAQGKNFVNMNKTLSSVYTV